MDITLFIAVAKDLILAAAAVFVSIKVARFQVERAEAQAAAETKRLREETTRRFLASVAVEMNRLMYFFDTIDRTYEAAVNKTVIPAAWRALAAELNSSQDRGRLSSESLFLSIEFAKRLDVLADEFDRRSSEAPKLSDLDRRIANSVDEFVGLKERLKTKREQVGDILRFNFSRALTLAAFAGAQLRLALLSQLPGDPVRDHKNDWQQELEAIRENGGDYIASVEMRSTPGPEGKNP